MKSLIILCDKKKDEDPLEKPTLAIALAADSHGSMISTANIFSKEAGLALKGLSRTGTVVGMIAGGVPAVYNIAKNFYSGNHQNWKDWAGFGLAALAGFSEFTGLGEIYDGTVGLTIATANLSYDIYNAATLK
jgi:hypothetical protein